VLSLAGAAAPASCAAPITIVVSATRHHLDARDERDAWTRDTGERD